MAKKKVYKRVKKITKKKPVDRPLEEFNNDIIKLERNAIKDVKEAEKWVIERRKFFIKLGITILLVIILLLISNIFMKIKGVSI